jgi:hypothetical protein
MLLSVTDTTTSRTPSSAAGADEELVARQRDRFVETAWRVLAEDLEVDDFLSMLTVRRVAPGSNAERFRLAFGEENARAGLVEELIERATTPGPVNQATLQGLGDLMVRFRDDDRPAVAGTLADVAVADLQAYAFGEVEALPETIRHLLAATARAGGQNSAAARRLHDYYQQLASGYAGLYGAVLATLRRKPIPDLSSIEDFAAVMTALLDGFILRATHDDPDEVERLLRACIIPIVASLTVHERARGGTNVPDLLFSEPPMSASASYLRSREDDRPAADDRVAGLCGTWRGTMWSDWVLKDDLPEDDGVREVYLSLDMRSPAPSVMFWFEGGKANVVGPGFVETNDGRLRLTAVYESERGSNATPERPSHRGGLVLETGTNAGDEVLTASYWTDRRTDGQFVFDERVDDIVESFTDGRNAFIHAGKPWCADDVEKARETLDDERLRPVA